MPSPFQASVCSGILLIDTRINSKHSLIFDTRLYDLIYLIQMFNLNDQRDTHKTVTGKKSFLLRCVKKCYACIDGLVQDCSIASALAMGIL